jgi:hypothetical protein
MRANALDRWGASPSQVPGRRRHTLGKLDRKMAFAPPWPDTPKGWVECLTHLPLVVLQCIGYGWLWLHYVAVCKVICHLITGWDYH